MYLSLTCFNMKFSSRTEIDFVSSCIHTLQFALTITLQPHYALSVFDCSVRFLFFFNYNIENSRFFFHLCYINECWTVKNVHKKNSCKYFLLNLCKIHPVHYKNNSKTHLSYRIGSSIFSSLFMSSNITLAAFISSSAFKNNSTKESPCLHKSESCLYIISCYGSKEHDWKVGTYQ